MFNYQGVLPYLFRQRRIETNLVQRHQLSKCVPGHIQSSPSIRHAVNNIKIKTYVRNNTLFTYIYMYANANIIFQNLTFLSISSAFAMSWSLAGKKYFSY